MLYLLWRQWRNIICLNYAYAKANLPLKDDLRHVVKRHDSDTKCVERCIGRRT